MNQKNILIILIVLIILGGIAFLAVKNKKTIVEPVVVTNFEECVQAGYPVMESYPEQCRTPDGRNFVHQVTPQQGTDQPPQTVPYSTKYFGEAVTLKTGKTGGEVQYVDNNGNSLWVKLTNIDDSRCPAKVQCIWAGELGMTLELSGGNLSNPGEIHLGAVSNKTATVENYTVTLKDETETSATIVVVKK